MKIPSLWAISLVRPKKEQIRFKHSHTQKDREAHTSSLSLLFAEDLSQAANGRAGLELL